MVLFRNAGRDGETTDTQEGNDHQRENEGCYLLFYSLFCVQAIFHKLIQELLKEKESGAIRLTHEIHVISDS